MLNLIIHSTLVKARLMIASAAPSIEDGSQKEEGQLLLTVPFVSGIHSLISFLLMILKGEWISGTKFKLEGREEIRKVWPIPSDLLIGYGATHLIVIPDPKPDRLPFDTPDSGFWPPS